MENDIKTMGWACAFVRTIILGPLSLIPIMWARSSWDGTFASIVTDAVILFIVFAIVAYSWGRAFVFGPFNEVQRFCNQSDNPEKMMKRLEKTWNEGFYTQNCRFDDEYFILASKMQSVVIALKDIHGIKYMDGAFWAPGDLWLYLKDNTIRIISIRDKQGHQILDNIKRNTTGIVVGERAVSRLLKTVIGKINLRYYLVQIQKKYFIVDYSNPNKLSSYLSWGENYRFTESGTKKFWRAWEVSESELQSIKYKQLTASTKQSDAFRNIILGSGLIIFAFFRYHPIFSALPINDLFKGQFWILFLFAISVFLAYFIYINIASKLDVRKYAEIRISRKDTLISKGHLIWYIILRVSFLIALLCFMVFMFIWNVGLLPYAIYMCVLYVYIFMGVWTGIPNIDPQSTILNVESPQPER